MPKLPRKTKAALPDWPTSIRLPDDLKKDLYAEAVEQERHLSWVIISILRQWQAFNKTQKKHKNTPKI